jgi:hypothetical protein
LNEIKDSIIEHAQNGLENQSHHSGSSFLPKCVEVVVDCVAIDTIPHGAKMANLKKEQLNLKEGIAKMYHKSELIIALINLMYEQILRKFTLLQPAQFALKGEIVKI